MGRTKMLERTQAISVVSPKAIRDAIDNLGIAVEYVSKETKAEHGQYCVRIVTTTSVYRGWKITVWCRKGTIRVQPTGFKFQLFYKNLSTAECIRVLQKPTNCGIAPENIDMTNMPGNKF